MRRPLFGGGLTLGIAGAILCASSALAQTPGNPDSSGNLTLATSQATTGASAAAVTTTGYGALYVSICNTTGSTEVHVDVSPDRGVTWFTVDDSTRALATECKTVSIPSPIGGYRTYTDTCNTCSVTSRGHVGSRLVTR